MAPSSRFGLNVYEMSYVRHFLCSFYDISIFDEAQIRKLDTIRYI